MNQQALEPVYRRILMPTDGSQCSQHAIRQGLALAKKLGSEVRFITVFEDPYAGLTPTDFSAYQPEIHKALKDAASTALSQAESMAESMGVPCQTTLIENMDAVKAIHEAEQDADLIVMGTHGRRGFNRWMFGSVAEGVLRRSETPCLMIHYQDSAQN